MRDSKISAQRLGRVYLPKIKIIGVGGGGSSIVGEIAKIFSKRKLKNLNKIDFLVANVDWQALKLAPRQVRKFYFGEEVTHGLGCGMNPEIGEKAARLVQEKFKKELIKTDLCIFISCLGGGTGSGAMPVFAQIASSLNLLSLGIFTLPFKFEGKKRQEIAKEAVEKIKPNLNSIIIIPNQKIFKLVQEKTSLRKALSSMNKILVQTLEGLIETIYQPGTINTDFADLKTIFNPKGRLAFLGCGIASGRNRASLALKRLLENPLTDFDFKNTSALLCNIAGSKNLKMKEIEKICRDIFQLNPKAKIIFGINPFPKLKDQIKITLLAVSSPQVPKKKKEEKQIKKKRGEIKEKKTQKKKKIRPEKPKIEKKARVRRNALDLHKIAQESEKELLEEEKKWDIPTFLRQKPSSSKNK
jgi:cell division protein FtsZ